MSEPADDPVYKALVRIGAFEQTVQPSVLTRDKYAALLDALAVSRYVGPFASDEQRARRASEAIKEAVATIVSPRDRLIAEAVLCVHKDFEGQTVGHREYLLLTSSERITHDIYREGRLRILKHVYKWMKNPPGRKGISGVTLLLGVTRGGIALYYANLAEIFRLEHTREDVGSPQRAWERFARASVTRAFDTFVQLAVCEHDVHIDSLFDELVPTSPPGSITELHDLVKAVIDAGPLEYHHIEAVRGLQWWRPREPPPPTDIHRYLFNRVWRDWYEQDEVQRAERLVTVSAPFAGYSDRYSHTGAIYEYRQREYIHKYFANCVSGYESSTRKRTSLREQLHDFLIQHSCFPDLTEKACRNQEDALTAFAIEHESVL
jgi:hypothetical protein